MTSSIKPSAVGAALGVLTLVATINVALSASLPTHFWVPVLREGGNFQYSEQHSKTPADFASSEQDTNSNSSVGAQNIVSSLGSNASLYEDSEVSSSGGYVGRLVFHPEDTEKQELTTAHSHLRRRLAKLGELYCEAEKYPLVAIPDGFYVKIMSPDYPRAYSNNSRCGWKIMSNPGHVLRVICPVFQLGHGDFTLINDYTNSPNLRFDDSTVMKNVTTASHKLFLGFKSDAEEEGKGFLCLVRSLPRAQTVESERPGKNVTGTTEPEVLDIKKRVDRLLLVPTNSTSSGNITEHATVLATSELSVTAIPTLSSKFSPVEQIMRSLPIALPVESESFVENVTNPIVLEVPDFKMRLDKLSTILANATSLSNVTERATAATVSELPVTEASILSSEFSLPEQYMRLLLINLPVGSESSVEYVTQPMDLDVLDFKKRLDELLMVPVNTASTGYVTDDDTAVTATEQPVTEVPPLSSEFLPIEQIKQSVPMALPVVSESSVEDIPDPMDLEVPDFTKQFDKVLTVTSNMTSTGNVTEQATAITATASEHPVTAVPALSSEFLPIEHIVQSLPMALPVGSESSVENDTNPMDVDVSDFKKSLDKRPTVSVDMTSTRNATEEATTATASELPFTVFPTSSSKFLPIEHLMSSLPIALHAGSESSVEHVTNPMDLEIPDFKKRLDRLSTVPANMTFPGNVIDDATATELSVTAVLSISSQSVLSLSSDLPSSHTVTTKEFLLALKRKAVKAAMKTYTVRRISSTYVTEARKWL